MAQKNIWNISTEELMMQHQVTKEGLTSQQVDKIRQEKGENILQEGKKKSIFQVFISQFADLLVVILIVAAVISMFSGNVESTIVILLVLVIASFSLIGSLVMYDTACKGTAFLGKPETAVFSLCKGHQGWCEAGSTIQGDRTR